MINNQEKLADYKALLSCLKDGELSELEAQQLLEDMSKNDEFKRELRNYWSRLQLAGQLMHGQIDHLVSEALTIEALDKVNLALEQTSSDLKGMSDVIAFQKKTTNTYVDKKKESLSTLGGLAIAASVMVVVSFGWLGSQKNVQQSVLAWLSPQEESVQLAHQVTDGQERKVQNINTQFQSKDSVLVGLNTAGTRAAGQTKKASELYLSEHRIEDYMLLHAEHASLNTNHGMLPFARMTKVSQANQF